jgi:long-chain acyl-CoA synthetase
LYPVKRWHDLKELTDTVCADYASHDAFRTMKDASEYVSVSYKRFGREICAFANSLIDAGLGGKSVAVLGENSYEWMLTYFSAINSNSTIVPLDKDLSKETLLEQFTRADARILFFSNTFSEEADYIKSHTNGVVTVSFREGCGADFTLSGWIDHGQKIVERGGDKYSNIAIDRDRTCAILFTSGTTGGSKGVMLSHRNLACNIVSATEIILIKSDDVSLSVLPIQHSWATMGCILIPLSQGATVAFCESIKTLPACMKLFKPTIMVLVPLYFETFHKRIWENAKKQGKEKKLRFALGLCNVLAAVGIDIRRKLLAEVLEFFGGRVRIMPCGGAPLNPALIKSFRSFGIRILHGYGTTECAPIVAANGDSYRRLGSDGYIFSCCKVKISDDGEILVKGENVMNGYLNDEKATAEAFVDGWYRTGDLGYVRDNFIYVTGRCKNLIVLKNGKNISPEEIEGKLSAIPLIAEVLVEEDPGNEYLVAQIYPEQTALKTMGEEALRREIETEIDRINQKLVPYKRVRRFYLRDTEFPKTTKRSIMRYQVKGGK